MLKKVFYYVKYEVNSVSLIKVICVWFIYKFWVLF